MSTIGPLPSLYTISDSGLLSTFERHCISLGMLLAREGKDIILSEESSELSYIRGAIMARFDRVEELPFRERRQVCLKKGINQIGEREQRIIKEGEKLTIDRLYYTGQSWLLSFRNPDGSIPEEKFRLRDRYDAKHFESAETIWRLSR